MKKVRFSHKTLTIILRKSIFYSLKRLFSSINNILKQHFILQCTINIENSYKSQFSCKLSHLVCKIRFRACFLRTTPLCFSSVLCSIMWHIGYDSSTMYSLFGVVVLPICCRSQNVIGLVTVFTY